MHKKLINFLSLNDVLHSKQCGFRKKCTTKLAVNQIVDEFIEAGENKMGNCYFCYLANVFNMVNHNILLNKTSRI